MKTKEVLLLLTDYWADWEACHAIVGINMADEYTVKTIAIDNKPKISIGGMRAEIDHSISDYQDFSNTAMIILTGSFSWGENPYNEIADFIKKARKANVPIAAICGATIFLAKHGFLNEIKHTGDTSDYFEEELKDEPGYKGHDNFSVAQCVNDGGFITANETASLDFAREIFRVLKTEDDDEIDWWYNNHKHGLSS
ncbi:MAG: DJ-1/PfpI family protein [Defluviitaleaceae bacterium]|nr:DJ-1/PfpI family protein [Defluviitaleaceae bacterium]